MARDSSTPGFDEFREQIESSSEPARTEWIQRFVAQFLQPDNDALRRIARREFFEQLRPIYTVEDIISRVGEKLEKRLRAGKLKLVSERKFLAYVTRMIQLALMDLNRLKPGGPTGARGLDNPDGSDLDPAAAGKGPATLALDADAAGRLRDVLRELLQPDEWFLIRRHYFEGATYEQIADEVLPPVEGTPTHEQVRNRADTIRMRLQRIRQELAEKEEDLAIFLGE